MMNKNQTTSKITNLPKIYVASTLANWKRVRSICDKFKSQGITITYDWSLHGERIFGQGTEIDPESIPPEDKLAEIALDEVQGVLDCDAILVIMPGERGSHFELAMAWCTGTPIVILMDGEIAPRPTSFHYLPRIERMNDEQRAIDRTIELARICKEFGVKPIRTASLYLMLEQGGDSLTGCELGEVRIIRS